jgi:hypothetical protein
MYKIDIKYIIVVYKILDKHSLKIEETLQGNLQHKFKCYELKKDGKISCIEERYMCEILVR